VIGEGVPLRELLLTYQVLELLPDTSFSFSEPTEFAVEIVPSVFSLADEVTGTINVNGVEGLWVARRNAHPDFRLAHQLSANARPWANNADGWGWEFLLPAVWQTYPDLAVGRRLALALESFVEDSARSRDLPIPYRWQFSNVFSASNPIWYLNLPRIVSMAERMAEELI
jgi:hypothetical protein